MYVGRGHRARVLFSCPSPLRGHLLSLSSPGLGMQHPGSALFLAGRRPGCGRCREEEVRPGALAPPQPLGARAPRDQTGAAEGGNPSLTPPPRPGWFRSLEPALRPVRRWLAGRGGSASHSRGPVSLAILTMRVEAWGPEAGTLWGDRGTHTAICPRGSRGDTRRPHNHGWKLPLHPGEWATLAPPRPHHAPTTPARLKFCSRGFAATVSPARSAFGSSASWAAVTRPPPSDTAAPHSRVLLRSGERGPSPAPASPVPSLSISLCPLISLPWSPSLPSLVPFCLFPPTKSLCSLSLASLWL